jgi:hypothetical protein
MRKNNSHQQNIRSYIYNSPSAQKYFVNNNCDGSEYSNNIYNKPEITEKSKDYFTPKLMYTNSSKSLNANRYNK